MRETEIPREEREREENKDQREKQKKGQRQRVRQRHRDRKKKETYRNRDTETGTKKATEIPSSDSVLRLRQQQMTARVPLTRLYLPSPHPCSQPERDASRRLPELLDVLFELPR